jgi:2-oxoglutarate/2-oxoacid ferredoxin oxidoreductase subunit alpha
MYKKYAIAEENEQRWEDYRTDDAEFVVVAYGILSRVVKTAVEMAREKGLKVGLLRPKAVWPFPKKGIEALIEKGKARGFIAMELSTGMMVEDVRLTVEGRLPVTFWGRPGGVVPGPPEVLAAIEKETLKIKGDKGCKSRKPKS